MSADLKESPIPLAEISQAPNAFEAFLDRNQKGIVVLAILLVLGAAAAVILRGIEKSRQESAGAALVKADDIATLQTVVSDHANTNAAGSAMVLLSDRQWAAGKQDDAIGTLQKFITDSPTHIAIPTAKASLGCKLMLQGKSGDAAKIFEDLASDPSAKFIAPFALISLGDISKAAGDTGKAEPFYTKVNTNFSDSSFAETASKRIATLRAKAPDQISPPPVAPTPSPVENPNSNPNSGSPSAPKP